MASVTHSITPSERLQNSRSSRLRTADRLRFGTSQCVGLRRFDFDSRIAQLIP